MGLIPAGAIATNRLLGKPFVGGWAAILNGAAIRSPVWCGFPAAATGAACLLWSGRCASLMPVKASPDPTWPTPLGLGLVSSVFDNIPLTQPALEPGATTGACSPSPQGSEAR